MKHYAHNSTTMHWTKRLLLASFLCVATTTQAQTVNTTYDVYAGQAKIGALDVRRQSSNQAGVATTVIDAAMQLRVKTFLSAYALDTKEHVVIGPKGVISFSADYEDGGKKSLVKGHLKDDSFLMKIQEGEEAYHFPLPPLGYDPAMLVLVERPHANTSDAIRFLDPDTFEFQNEQRADIGKETIKLADNTLSCQVIEFKTPTSNGKRWIAEDALGSFLVKEVGSDRDGPYSLLMTSYTRLN